MSNRASFEELGYAFCQSFMSPARVLEIRENVSRLMADVVPTMPSEHVFYEDKSDPSSLKQLQEIHKRDEFFGKLMSEGPFRELAQELLCEEVTCQNMQYFNKPPRIGRPTPPHQDGYYFKLEPPQALTMWFALEDVDAENGCVRYVPRSHKMGMRSHGKTGTLGFSQGIIDFPSDHDSKNEVAFPAKPGDLLVHHALTIHRADGNQSVSRTRQALGFIYYGVSAKVDSVAKEQYRRQVKNGLL